MIAAALLLLAADAAPAPVLVELFTSQSCSSCPPAEADFRKLAARPDIVALEWHVDYWNDISVGTDGRWRDPFSSAANTERQRSYNLRLRRRAAVYTPQVIVNGATETVGSRGAEIAALVSAAKNDPRSSIEIARRGDAVSIAASGPEGAHVALVRFVPSATTRIGGGENATSVLAEANIATSLETLGTLSGSLREFASAGPAPGERCAVIIERPGGPTLAARYCP